MSQTAVGCPTDGQGERSGGGVIYRTPANSLCKLATFSYGFSRAAAVPGNPLLVTHNNKAFVVPSGFNKKWEKKVLEVGNVEIRKFALKR